MNLLVSSRTQSTEVTLFIVVQEVPVTLSGHVAERLGLIQRIDAVNAEASDILLSGFDDIFQGLGQLEGITYCLQLNPDARPTIKPARRIAVALQEPVKAKLDEMERDGVITKVKEPCSWSIHMVVVLKNGKVRICLDPSDLNKPILREHYHMPTLEDVLLRLEGAKYFYTLDAASGFWQITLDEQS